METKKKELKVQPMKEKMEQKQIMDLHRSKEKEEKRREGLRKLKEQQQQEEELLMELRNKVEILELEKQNKEYAKKIKVMEMEKKVEDKSHQLELLKLKKKQEAICRLKEELEDLEARKEAVDLELDTSPVDWDCDSGWNAPEDVTISTFTISSINGDGVLVESTKKTATVRLKPKPFGRGSFRLAYYMKMRFPGTTDQRYVAKAMLRSKGPEKDREECLQNIEAQIMSDEIAKLYNANPVMLKKLNFVRPFLLHFNSRENPIYMTAEPILEGRWRRFTNNAGYVSEEKFATVFAFSHFSHHASGGKLMVVDLQGIQVPEGYLLTDPAVHCQNTKKFGGSNCGKKGFDGFWATHRCNQVCQALRLLKNSEQVLGDECTGTVVRSF